MNNSVLKVGIAGYGVVGSRRRHFIDNHPNLKTYSICDQSFKDVGIKNDGVKYFNHYNDLIKEPIDVLFVCLPNYMAADVTIAGLERGIHVFCEKPPGKDVSDIQRVINVEKKHRGLKLKYGFNHRYHDSIIDAFKIVQSRDLGGIVNLRGLYGKSKMNPFVSTWRSDRKYAGGGILLDQGIHLLDLMQLFCGEFLEVKSFVSNTYWNYDVEDNAYAIMKDNNGRTAIIHSSATQWQHRFVLEITLENGYLELRGILSGSKSYGEEQLIIGKRNDELTGAQRDETITYLNDNSWSCEIDEFTNAILENGEVLHGTSREALSVMKLVYRIYYSDPIWRDKYNIQNPDNDNL